MLLLLLFSNTELPQQNSGALFREDLHHRYCGAGCRCRHGKNDLSFFRTLVFLTAVTSDLEIHVKSDVFPDISCLRLRRRRRECELFWRCLALPSLPYLMVASSSHLPGLHLCNCSARWKWKTSRQDRLKALFLCTRVVRLVCFIVWLSMAHKRVKCQSWTCWTSNIILHICC